MMYVGIGQDSHRFEEGGVLVLGGITIDDACKLRGNSDGDAVLHALCNALSSAMGGGSFGVDADVMCRDEGIVDSSAYVRYIMDAVDQKNLAVHNVSIALEAGAPRLEKHFGGMREVIATLLRIETGKIGITVTSGEDLTAFGRGEGISVFTCVSLYEQT